jgi:hypothetical protein
VVNWFKKKTPAETGPQIRDTLFGDMPFEEWAQPSHAHEPWASFRTAKNALDGGDRQACIGILKDIVSRTGLESRHYVQAWHFLRQLGVVPPPEKAQEILGVVVEVGMKNGLDLLAAYSDLSARYYNFSGAGVVWERPDATLDACIQRLLDSAKAVVGKTGPWTGSRPAVPSRGNIRINMLTPNGLHFGQARFKALASDQLGGPVVLAATALMQEMIKKTKK